MYKISVTHLRKAIHVVPQTMDESVGERVEFVDGEFSVFGDFGSVIRSVRTAKPPKALARRKSDEGFFRIDVVEPV